MRKEHIEVGRAYVNEQARIVREVTEEVDAHRVKFNTFDLNTGKLLPTRHKVLSRAQLARWADREASAPETASVHPYAAAAGLEGRSPSESGTSLAQAKSTIEGDPGHQMFPRSK